MTERRKYTGKERRGRAGKVFQTAEEIRKRKEEVADKLREYEAGEGVRVSVASTLVLVAVCALISAPCRVHSVRV